MDLSSPADLRGLDAWYGGEEGLLNIVCYYGQLIKAMYDEDLRDIVRENIRMLSYLGATLGRIGDGTN